MKEKRRRSLEKKSKKKERVESETPKKPRRRSKSPDIRRRRRSSSPEHRNAKSPPRIDTNDSKKKPEAIDLTSVFGPMSDSEDENTKKPALTIPEPKNEIDNLTNMLKSNQSQFYQEAMNEEIWVIRPEDDYWYESICKTIKTLLEMSTKNLYIFTVPVPNHFRNLRNLLSSCILFPVLFQQKASEIMHSRLPLLQAAQRQMFQNSTMSLRQKAQAEDAKFLGRCLTNKDKIVEQRILNFYDEEFLPSELLLTICGIELCRTKNQGVKAALLKVIHKHPKRMRKRIIQLDSEDDDCYENDEFRDFLDDEAVSTSESESE